MAHEAPWKRKVGGGGGWEGGSQKLMVQGLMWRKDGVLGGGWRGVLVAVTKKGEKRKCGFLCNTFLS